MQDRIYAILGLITTEIDILLKEFILVDYAQSTIEIFKKFTLFLRQITNLHPKFAFIYKSPPLHPHFLQNLHPIAKPPLHLQIWPAQRIILKRTN